MNQRKRDFYFKIIDRAQELEVKYGKDYFAFVQDMGHRDVLIMFFDRDAPPLFANRTLPFRFKDVA